MRKFTKEEISLCKQVAEKHRIKIEYGDWYWSSAYPKILLAMDYGFKPTEQEFAGVFKIWTISDCLEFLRERGFTVIQACEHPMSNEWIVEINPYFSNAVKIMGHNSFDVRGDTLLIACLKAVLAVLKEESK